VTSDGYAEGRARVLDARDRGDVTYLLDALVDPYHRALAASSLGELRADDAIEPLIRLLSATDPHVRSSAATALGDIGSTTASAPLREVVTYDDDASVRSQAIGAIGRISGSADTTKFLLPFLLDPSMKVRSSTAIALGRLGDPRALSPLLSARRRLWRSPTEWWLFRRAYDDAISALRPLT